MGLRFSEGILFFRSTLGVCPGVASVVSSDIRVQVNFFYYYSRRFEFFLRLTPALSPLLRFVGDVFPRGIPVVVGFGVRQSSRFVVEPLGDKGRVSTVSPVR